MDTGPEPWDPSTIGYRALGPVDQGPGPWAQWIQGPRARDQWTKAQGLGPVDRAQWIQGSRALGSVDQGPLAGPWAQRTKTLGPVDQAPGSPRLGPVDQGPGRGGAVRAQQTPPFPASKTGAERNHACFPLKTGAERKIVFSPIEHRS